MESGCPDEETILAFLQGQLHAAERATVELHVGGCGSCADLATWAAADVVASGRTPGREGWAFLGRLSPGDYVGRYQILGAVGHGGMGEVYAAYHPDLDRRIALKVVYDAPAQDPARQDHLLREARMIARLPHPNIVTVHDAGVADGRVYVAMEFVEGQTIDAWMREGGRRRTLDEILRVFVAAGRGLSAAHGAQIVHRDFKPQNVLIARDGTVKVADFGLARPIAEMPVPPASVAPLNDGRPITETAGSRRAGTPAYMAPEQLRGEPIDARADQYSFCVALYEALTGERPALGSPGLAPDVGPRPPRGGTIPPWLRATLRRGFSADRERRFPSMRELLAAIEHGLGRPRRVFIALGVAAGLAAVVAGTWRLSRVRQFSCAPPRDRLGAVWSTDEGSGSRRAVLHRAFQSSGLADAEAIWARVATILDGRVAQWVAMYTDVCQATHLRGAHSDELLDQRMTCLDEGLDEMRSYTDGLLEIAPKGLGRAVAAANMLAPVRQCNDLGSLRLQAPLPSAPSTRAAVERLARTIKDAAVLVNFGSPQQAVKRLTAALPEARAVGYKPVLAQTLQGLGAAQSRLMRLGEAQRAFREALLVAEAGRDDLTAAKAAEGMGFTATVEARFADADYWFALGEAVLDRLQARDSLVGAWILNDRGALFGAVGDPQAARLADEAAIRIKRSLLGEDDPDVAITTCGLAGVIAELDQPAEAAVVARRGRESLARRGDTGSSEYAVCLDIEAKILIDLGRYDEAAPELEQSLRIAADIKDTGIATAYTLTLRGELALARGRSADAVTDLSRARALQASVEHDPTYRAETAFALARALVAAEGDRSQAEPLAHEACQGFADGHRPRQAAAVRKWATDTFGRTARTFGVCAALAATLPAQRSQGAP